MKKKKRRLVGQEKGRWFSYASWLVVEPIINRRIQEVKKHHVKVCDDYIHALLDIKKLLKGRIDYPKKDQERRGKKKAYTDYFLREARGEVDLNDPLRILITR